MSEKLSATSIEIETPETNPAADQTINIDPFAPENLRLSQSFNEMAGVKKLLTTVPVRKPGAQDWVRVRPGPEWRENFPIIDLKDDREQYIVTAALVPELMSEVVNATLFTAINKQGTLFFWPIRLPGFDGRDLDWWRSGREAAERATEAWVRVKANTNLAAYEIYEAAGSLGEPVWPSDLNFWDLIKIAFKDHLIGDLEHPVIQRLRGLI
jgi:hypothetical protein